MPDTQTAILLRRGAHDSTATNTTTRVRYALQCDNFSVQIAKTPIQVPNALNSPILIDIGFQRPSISINGTLVSLEMMQRGLHGHVHIISHIKIY